VRCSRLAVGFEEKNKKRASMVDIFLPMDRGYILESAIYKI
jgi:hypothetical protein